MIRYRLVCSRNHEFDAWFASSAAYEAQESGDQLVCPHCGDKVVTRAIMAPRISKSAKSAAASQRHGFHDQTPQTDDTNTADTIPSPPAPALRPSGPEVQHLKSALSELHALRQKILSKSEYVGPRFADEARRIHEEEAPDRAIHGEATAEEVRELTEDGIDVTPIPRLPEDNN
ncbi:MAG: DUF1178 family protein [Hyphomicrobiaceae bacterium]